MNEVHYPGSFDDPHLVIWIGDGYTRFLWKAGEEVFAWWLHPWQIEDLEDDFRRAPRGT